MAKGIVEWFDETKGHGFIKNKEGNHIYVCYSSIQGGEFQTLAEGDTVSFDIEHNPGGTKAVNVVKVE